MPFPSQRKVAQPHSGHRHVARRSFGIDVAAGGYSSILWHTKTHISNVLAEVKPVGLWHIVKMILSA